MKMSHDNATLLVSIQSVLQATITPQCGSVWKHYKGSLYKIKGLVIQEATEEIAVCYEAVVNPLPIPWSRTLREWNEEVEHNGVVLPRFSPATAESTTSTPHTTIAPSETQKTETTYCIIQ